MWLIVGLGNPGPKYQLTRHNIGFITVDLLAESLQVSRWKSDHQGLIAQAEWPSTNNGVERVYLLKPQTYMNLSGQSVQAALQFYKIPVANLIVIQDEVDLPYGQLRFVKNRGSGGHNGIKDITEKLGSPDYIRMRMGVGRPPVPGPSVPDYVLQNFSAEEMTRLSDFANGAIDGIELLIRDGFNKASSKVNSSK